MDNLVASFMAVLPVFLIVLGNALFVAAEFSVVRSHPTKLKNPEMKGKWGVSAAISLLENIERTVSTTQLGITIWSLVLGWFGESVFHDFFIGFLTWIESPFVQSAVAHTIATACALVVVTFLHVVLGELVAKSVAIRHPETTLRLLAPFLLFVSKVTRPAVIILNGSANVILRVFGMPQTTDHDRVHSPGELAMLISQSTDKGVLDEDEEQMLHGVFNFSETIAREVMTPRTDLVTISKDATLHDILATVSKSGFSRFPVIDRTIDNIVGVLLSKDLLAVVEQYVNQPSRKFDVTAHMREPFFIPGTKSINDLLKELKRTKLHMAIVLDEHGGVDGAVTLEDLIEEIVGEIYDESDEDERNIVVEDSGDIVLDGGVLVDEVNEQFELDIPEGEYDTIAGFILSSLGRVPIPGDQIAINQAGVPLVNEDGATNGANGHTSSGKEDADSEPEGLSARDIERPKAVFIVEKVVGNRIETIRVQQQARLSETLTGQGALAD